MSDKWEWRKRLHNSDDIKFVRKHINHLTCDAVTIIVKKSPRVLQRAFSFAFSVIASVTPEVPIDLKHLSRQSRGWTVFRYGYAISLVFCFVVTALLAQHAGTLSGTDPNTKYFLHDGPNVLNYLVICPTYIGLCFWIIYLFVSRYHSIATLAESVEVEATSPANRSTSDIKPISKWIYSINGFLPQFFWFLGAATLFTAVLTYNYIVDLLQKENRYLNYWFMTSVNGTRYLNSVGIYYALLNFMLLFVSVISVLCFVSLFIETVRLGDAIGNLNGHADLTQAKLRSSLESFTEAYIVAKCLCAAYIVNIFFWQPSPLGGKTWNVAIALVFVLVMGLFFISFPRYYVELMWYKYGRRLKSDDKLLDIASLHSSKEDLWIPWVDRFFIGGCLTKFVVAPYFGSYISAFKSWLTHLVTIMSS